MSGRVRCGGGWRGAKNEIHAVLIRRLQGRPPVTDVFGVRGRRWLSELELPADERETIAGCLRHVDFLDAEVAALDRAIASEALRHPDVLRLMTVPGVVVTDHTAWYSEQSVADLQREAAEEIARVFNGQPPLNWVNRW